MCILKGPSHGVLLIQTAFIGDLLLTIPLARRLKELLPEHPLTLLCRKGLGDILLATKVIDHAVEVDKRDRNAWKQIGENLKQKKYKWVVCPHRSFTSARLVSSLKADKKIGYSLWWNFTVFDHRVQRPLIEPEVIRQLYLISELDKVTGKRLESYSGHQKSALSQVPTWASMELSETVFLPSKTEILKKKYLSRWSDGEKKIISVAPGSVWPTKRWRLDGYKQLIAELLDRDFSVILLGSPDERGICDEIEESQQQGRRSQVVNLSGETSLLESLYLMKLTSVLVANDSGAMHMASVAGVPCVSIFGPTTLGLGYRPWQNNAAVVENKNLSCRPCGKHGHRKCPIGTHECMTSLKVPEVLSQLGLLANDPFLK